MLVGVRRRVSDAGRIAARVGVRVVAIVGIGRRGIRFLVRVVEELSTGEHVAPGLHV